MKHCSISVTGLTYGIQYTIPLSAENNEKIGRCVCRFEMTNFVFSNNFIIIPKGFRKCQSEILTYWARARDMDAKGMFAFLFIL